MSRAFDTIDRNIVLRVLADAAVDEDELRIVRTLLADTKLRVRVGQAISEWFRTLIGSPQGDSISPALFTSYLASALEGLRDTFPWIRGTEGDHPNEWDYADDVDFIHKGNTPKALEELLPEACVHLESWDLFVNMEKTEFAHVHLANNPEE